VHHLLYKALIELSDNRADFLSRLFVRPRPAGLAATAPVDTLFAAFANVPPDSLLFYQTLAAVKDRTFIRSGRVGGGGGYGGGFGGGGRGVATSLLQSITELVKATADNRIQRYQDVLQLSH